MTDKLTGTQVDICPFCGEHEKLRVHFTEDMYCFVICGRCCAHGPSQALLESHGSARQDSINLWNNRRQH